MNESRLSIGELLATSSGYSKQEAERALKQAMAEEWAAIARDIGLSFDCTDVPFIAVQGKELADE